MSWVMCFVLKPMDTKKKDVTISGEYFGKLFFFLTMKERLNKNHEKIRKMYDLSAQVWNPSFLLWSHIFGSCTCIIYKALTQN